MSLYNPPMLPTRTVDFVEEECRIYDEDPCNQLGDKVCWHQLSPIF